MENDVNGNVSQAVSPLIELIFKKLVADRNENESILEILLNTNPTAVTHIDCIDILDKISSINNSIATLNKYL